MGITIEEVIDNELLCKDIIRLLPKKCKCGSDIMFSDSLTGIYCTNNNCSEVLVYRIINFCNKNNIEIKYIEAKNIVDKLRILTPYQILLFDNINNAFKEIKSILQNSNDFIQKVKEAKNKEYTLCDVVKMCGIQTVELVADKIFDGFYSFDEAFGELEQSQLVFIGERLGTKGVNSSSFSLFIYSELLKLKDELLLAETQLKIKGIDKEILHIAFNSNIDNFCNMNEVIEYLNANSDYKCVLSSTVDNNTDILISDININTSKYKIAKMINDKFIAEKMNNGELKLDDIGKTVDSQLKPLGCKIFIDNIDNVIHRVCNIKR